MHEPVVERSTLTSQELGKKPGWGINLSHRACDRCKTGLVATKPIAHRYRSVQLKPPGTQVYAAMQRVKVHPHSVRDAPNKGVNTCNYYFLQ